MDSTTTHWRVDTVRVTGTVQADGSVRGTAAPVHPRGIDPLWGVGFAILLFGIWQAWRDLSPRARPKR